MGREAEPKMTIAEPNLSKVLPWQTLLAAEFDDQEDRECAADYYSRARGYLESHRWCRGIKESYVGMFYSQIVSVSLFKIDPGENIGDWMWVIVGDIPPATLPLAAGENPAMALDVYLGEMQEWVDAVDKGRSVEDLLPVNAPPTKEYADMLRGRLEFIGERILLAEYRDQLGYDPDEED